MSDTTGPLTPLEEQAAGVSSVTRSAAPQRRLSLAWPTIATLVVLDQLTKWLVVENIPVYASITVIPGLLDLVHVHNPGIAFGFLSDFGHSWQSSLTTGLALTALAGILYYASQLPSEERIARYGLSLILAGAVGNLIDRARQGFVVDFVDVYWHDWHFWAFNVADAAISIGAVLILVELILPKHHASNPV